MINSFDEPETAESVVAACASGVCLAFPVAGVEEISEHLATGPLANGPKHVVGAVELRGAWIPVIDFAAFMGGEALALDVAARSLVVAEGERRFALLVSEVRGIVPVGARRQRSKASAALRQSWVGAEVDVGGQAHLEVNLAALFAALSSHA